MCQHPARFTADFMLMEFAIDYFFEAGEGHIMSQFYTPDLLKGWVESFAQTGTPTSMYYDLQTKHEWDRFVQDLAKFSQDRSTSSSGRSGSPDHN